MDLTMIFLRLNMSVEKKKHLPKTVKRNNIFILDL